MVTWVWIEFSFLALGITYAGFKVSYLGDQIASKTKLGRNLVGIILLSTVTSLPELATGISSVAINNNPNLALGDIFGSCSFNLGTVVILDLIYRKGSVYSRNTQGHILTGLMGIILIGLAGMGLALKDQKWLEIGHVSIISILIPLIYIFAIRELFQFEKTLSQKNESSSDGQSLKRDLIYFALYSTVIIVLGSYLPVVAEKIIHLMNWNAAFVGTLFVALVTSLPEISVTISALKINAVEMAFSNLLGSNIFNIVILAIDDFFYFDGSIFAAASEGHGVTFISALMMTGLVLVALMKPPQVKILNIISFFSILILGVYSVALYVVYQGIN